MAGLYQTDAFYAFHYVNAFDDPDTGDVVIDISVYPDTSVIGKLYLDKLRSTSEAGEPWMGRARRYRLPDPSKVAVRLSRNIRSRVVVHSPCA